MRVGLLGPSTVNCGDAPPVAVSAARQRVVLAALALRAGRVVSFDELAAALWDGEPPAGARVTVRTYILRLRRALGATAILTREPGYLLDAAVCEVDVAAFTALCRVGGAACRSGDWERAAGALEQALGLWRGTPLADIPSPALRREWVPHLEQLWLQASELRAGARLRLGQPEEVAGELERLAAAHPLREQVHALLMLALYRSGRIADALAAYRNVRQVLAAELGVEPGEELARLHQQILARDPVLAASRSPLPSAPSGGTRQPGSGGASAGPGPGAPRGRPARPVPRQLPTPVAGFVGRAAELDLLEALVGRVAAGGQGAASAGSAENDGETAVGAGEIVVIAAVGGMAGVGKTALAVHLAHQMAERFPDGQLYVDLRGFGRGTGPVAPEQAVRGFLDALGVLAQVVPADPDAQAGLYRSLVAGRRMLIVLDNVLDAAQVRPLLPGAPGSLVLVTSRNQLTALATAVGAHLISLDLLDDVEARALLAARIGPQRTGAEPRAAAELVRLCAGLPLALSIAAARAAARPAHPLAVLASELADTDTRLDALDAGEADASVRAAFSWSYDQLSPAAARMFRLTGLHPGPDVTEPAAASLAGVPQPQVRGALRELAGASLVTEHAPGRYVLHDLLRAYAAERAYGTDTQNDRHAAIGRVLDHYLHTASVAMDTLYPAERHHRPCIPLSATPAPPVTEPAAARAWLDAERATLVAITVHAAAYGWPTHATRLSATLFRYLDTGGHHPDALKIHSHARAAARHAGDQAAEAAALKDLAGVHHRQSRYQQATDHLQQALASFQQVGDLVTQARALDNLGTIHYYQGRYHKAIGLHRQALAIFGEADDPFGEANALNNLGFSEERQGRYDLAARHLRKALAIATYIEARDLECNALVNLGTVGLRQGRYRQAAGHLNQGLALSREIGYRGAEAEALARSAALCLREGNHDEAARQLRQALALYREVGRLSGEADALNRLGEVLLATGQPDHARDEHAAALGLARQVGDKYQQAGAHHGIGQACHAHGDPSGACRHWQQALDLFTRLGTPEAGQVRAQLAVARDDSHQEQKASR